MPVTDAERRIDRLTRQIEALLPDWSMEPVVRAIQAMRGAALISAVTIVAEVGDFTRFGNPRRLMAYLGMVPCEHSSGARLRRGGIKPVCSCPTAADRRRRDLSHAGAGQSQALRSP
jgi:transposase